ncbi:MULTISPECIES: NfeD family protein [unclassified Fusibacter]|uniref:NfeD family protein n=1 Tax=unclassified Fusibacter TaxID=2624464 RepID=UPI001012FEDA|nr:MULTISPECIES: NfeD family protein [unclassified Fusibacter]MCK8059621.1 NfeD family protein [Fusibacter sp. A2]NPE21422.1 NfeD family protein [Fusibacter sp. A1]RXV61834.1 hypothetical protein DWB64_06250 [Fusibacter sp. A1]
MLEQLLGLEKFYLYVAVPASIILIIQTVLTLVGASGEIDVDFDADGDTDVIGGSGLSLFTIRNLIAFFTFFGWSGLWLLSSGVNKLFTVVMSFFIGVVFMGISMGTFYLISKMQRSGTLNIKNAQSHIGEVYIRIPANREATGKVLIKVQGALRELEAVTDDVDGIKTGTQVKVVDILDNSKLVVTKFYFD